MKIESLLSHDKLEFLTTRLRQTNDRVKEPGAVIEVGCYKGGTITQMRKTIGGARAFIGYDTFYGLPRPTKMDLVDTTEPHKEGDFGDVDFKEFAGEIHKHGIQIYRGRFPEGATDFPVMFAHVDTDLHDDISRPLIWLYRNLVMGGEIVVDDYGWHRTPGVKIAVDEQIRIKRFSEVARNGNQIALVKT